MVLIGGHRGSGCTDSAHAAPYGHHKPAENTLLSIHKALSDGADIIEVDVVQTKDNQLAVTHSNNLNQHVQSAENLAFVGDYTLSELKEMPVGMHQTGKMPELCEVLDLCQHVALNIEIKDVKGTSAPKFIPQKPLLLEQLAAALKAHQGEVVVSSFSLWDMAQAAKLMPAIKRGMLFVPDAEAEKPVYKNGEDGSCYLHFTPENVRLAGQTAALSYAHPCMGSLAGDALAMCEKLNLGINAWSLEESPPLENPEPLQRCTQLCQQFNRPLAILTDFIPEMQQWLKNN